MRKGLFMNGVEIMAIIDNKYYITDYEWECFKECSRNQFIEELKNLSWVCLTTWSDELKKEYLDLVEYTNNMK